VHVFMQRFILALVNPEYCIPRAAECFEAVRPFLPWEPNHTKLCLSPLLDYGLRGIYALAHAANNSGKGEVADISTFAE
jgi:hypothetical protein